MIKKLLINAVEVAKCLGVSVATVHRLNNSGLLPAPIKLGRSIRWPVKEINDWIDAGSPPRVRWDTIREG